MLRTALLEIRSGDMDCSRLVQNVWQAVGVFPQEMERFTTWTEVELLRRYGFVQVSLTNLEAADVLWKPGHTEFYLGDGYQGGARIDEVGGTSGPCAGDQTGREIARSPFDQRYWKWQGAFRYAGGVTVNGIPARVAALQVANHYIDHAAHGYSQDNRDGSGTEFLEVTWDDGRRRAREMDCIISIRGANTLVWFDGVNVNDLTTTGGVMALDKISTATNGTALPRVELTQEEFARLCQSIKGGYPKHLKGLVDKYPPRSPEGD